MPEEGNGEKYILSLFFFFFAWRDLWMLLQALNTKRKVFNSSQWSVERQRYIDPENSPKEIFALDLGCYNAFTSCSKS